MSFWSWLISLPLSVFKFHSPLCMSEFPSLLRLNILYCTSIHTDYRMCAEQIGCFSLFNLHDHASINTGIHTHAPLISKNSKWASKRINEWMTTPIFRELRGRQPDWEMLGKKKWEREDVVSSMILRKAGPDQNLVCVSLCNGSGNISQKVHSCGFINPSYTNLPWSAVPLGDINYWNPCGQQREGLRNPPEPSKANGQTPCLSSRSLKQTWPGLPKQEVISNCSRPLTSGEGWGVESSPSQSGLTSSSHCKFTVLSLGLGRWGIREDRYWFIFQSSFSGRREDYSCLRKEGQNYRFTLYPESSKARGGKPSLLLG